MPIAIALNTFPVPKSVNRIYKVANERDNAPVIKGIKPVFLPVPVKNIVAVANTGISQKAKKVKLSFGKGFSNPSVVAEVLKKSPDTIA